VKHSQDLAPIQHHDMHDYEILIAQILVQYVQSQQILENLRNHQMIMTELFLTPFDL
jgi:hypothetical protein